jgi:hypothetical protein
MELIKGIVDTLMSSEATDLTATETLTMPAGKSKPGKTICEAGKVIALAGDYEKSQNGNKQAQRRVRKSMAIVAMLAKLEILATKK